MRIPDGEVGAIDDAVRAKPEEQVCHHLRKEARAIMDKGQRHRQGAVHIRTARRDPAEIVEPWQADVINNEVQFGVEPGRLVDITYIELGEGERLDGRTFMEVHILHAHFNALLIEREDHWVIGAPAPRLTAPLGGVPFEAFDATVIDLAAHLVHGVRHTWINSAQGDNTLRGTFTHLHVFVGGAEASMVKVHQHLRRENGHISVTLDKYLIEIPVGINLAELGLVVHRPFLLGRIESGVEGIEGLDEGIPKAVLGVFLAGVPKSSVCIQDK